MGKSRKPDSWLYFNTLNMVSTRAWRTGTEVILVSPGMACWRFKDAFIIGIFVPSHRGPQIRRSIQWDQGSSHTLRFSNWSGFRNRVQHEPGWVCRLHQTGPITAVFTSTGCRDLWMSSLMPRPHLRSTEYCEGNRIHSRSTYPWKCGPCNATGLLGFFFFLYYIDVLCNCLLWTKLKAWTFPETDAK